MKKFFEARFIGVRVGTMLVMLLISVVAWIVIQLFGSKLMGLVNRTRAAVNNRAPRSDS